VTRRAWALVATPPVALLLIGLLIRSGAPWLAVPAFMVLTLAFVVALMAADGREQSRQIARFNEYVQAHPQGSPEWLAFRAGLAPRPAERPAHPAAPVPAPTPAEPAPVPVLEPVPVEHREAGQAAGVLLGGAAALFTAGAGIPLVPAAGWRLLPPMIGLGLFGLVVFGLEIRDTVRAWQRTPLHPSGGAAQPVPCESCQVTPAAGTLVAEGVAFAVCTGCAAAALATAAASLAEVAS
jgi:hypothetical protein